MNKDLPTLEQKKSQIYSVKSNQLEATIKDVDTGSRTVTGFFNTYNVFDSACDVLLMGCAKKSIKERGPNSPGAAKIKHLLQHDMDKPIGKIKVLEEKTIDGLTGIYFESKMSNSTDGNDALIKYQEEIYDNHSIGFRYIDVEMVERANEKKWNKAVDMLVNPKATEGKNVMFLVKEIAKYEGSTVTFGCNELTPFLGVKSGNAEGYYLKLSQKMDKIQKMLTSGTVSDESMESLSIQFLQMKQLMKEMCDMIPADKNKQEAIKVASVLSSDAVKNFSLK